ncbi:MAG: MBL fold metallo-hydrolase [Patescibacteria group bacterium]
MGEPDYRRAKIILTIATLVIVTALILLFVYSKQFFAPSFKVIFFNVGQGDSTLIRFANGEKMLVDCGPDKIAVGKLGEYLPFYDRTIDYLLITHPDLDHYGGCVDVLKRYNVKNIITNGDTKPDDSYYQIWDKYNHAENANEILVNNPTTTIISGASLNFLSPDTDFNLGTASGGNNNSIVFLFKYNTTTILFTGDMETVLEKEIINKYCLPSGEISRRETSSTITCENLDADYLKIGHHGSDSSSDEEFLNFVSPKFAIISVGKNSFGHPSLRTIRKLERVGAVVWRTDEKDDIIVP